MRRYLVSLLLLLAVGASAWAQKFKYETEPVLGKGAAPVLPAILSDRPAKFTYHIRTEAPDMFLTKGSSYFGCGLLRLVECMYLFLKFYPFVRELMVLWR